MAERWQDVPWAKEIWCSGKTTRPRFLGLSAATAGALGATMLVPAPWREAFGQAKPYKIGIMQPLTGVAAAGGKTALVGSMMGIDRINKAGGVNGRPLEAVVADYESKPDVGRRRVEKLLVEDQVDVAEGGYLSNVCLACMPVFDEHRTVFMVGVCLDTTITTTKCSRYVFRPFDYAPAQAVAFAPRAGPEGGALPGPHPSPPGPRRAAEHALPQEVLRGVPRAAQADRPLGAGPGPLRAVELRGDELPQARHAEVGLPRARGHDEAHRGARGHGGEGERRLPPG